MLSRPEPRAVVRSSEAELTDEPVVARQHHAAAVEQRQEVAIDFALVALAGIVADAALVELLARKLTTKAITE